MNTQTIGAGSRSYSVIFILLSGVFVLFKKIVSFFLCFATVLSLVSVSAFAARPAGNSLIYDAASVSAWDSWLDANILLGINMQVVTVSTKSRYWDEIDQGMSAAGLGACSDLESLHAAKDNWNGCVATFWNLTDLLIYCFTSRTVKVPTAKVAYDDSLGVYRLREYHSNLWLVNSSGHFPYYRPESSSTVDGIGQWIPYDRAIANNTALWHTVIGADLSAYAESWTDRRVHRCESSDYFYLAWNDPDEHNKAYVLCDDYGYPYYVPKPKQTAVTTPNNYYTELGDTYTDNSVTDNSTNVNVYDKGTAVLGSILELENGILNVGGQAYYVDEINYDASTKTYSVDSHDAYLWNSTTNNYVTNNYKWEVNFNIDYTSVTYIGQTEEYEERYEFYYELPDGRSSADLTTEDLEQLSGVFYDVMNYSRAADDSALRALYHFDGNTEDSSYWSYTRHGFEWNKGASLTYMDEGTFGGSLYLDETEHEFEITLPGNDAGYKWTLQFRYYQSHTLNPVKDSYLSVGGTPLLYFTGSQYLNKDGAVICATSVGTWNEICLVRYVDNGGFSYLAYYINGVYYGNVKDSYHTQEILFHFGSQQQTYKKLDELRFTKRDIYTPGVNYSPSVVPYDTNLSLILPGATDAIADEYIVVTPSSSNILSAIGGGDWSKADFIKRSGFIDYTPWAYECNCRVPYFYGMLGSTKMFYESDYTSVHQGEFGSIVTSSTSNPIVSANSGVTRKIGAGFFYPVYMAYSNNGERRYTYDFGGVSAGDNCMTVVLADGTSSSIVFSVVKDNDAQLISSSYSLKSKQINSDIDFALNSIGSRHFVDIGSRGHNEEYCYGISIYSKSGKPVEILYVEVVAGSKPGCSVKHEVVLYDPQELAEDFILAVKSNRPVTSYQIGGVRPSYAEAGQVYAAVENNRIVSLQQYTGYVWEAVDGRIWTGERWIPYYSFDLKTFQDLYDLIGTTDDYEYIYSESGFWSWFQKQWSAFMGKLDIIIERLNNGSDGGSVDLEDDQLLNKDDYDGIVGLLFNCYHFLSGFFSDFVVGSIGDLVVDLDNSESQYFSFFKLGGG